MVSCGTREWNTMMIVPVVHGRPPMNENTGVVSGDALGTCTDLLSMKA